MAVFVNTNVSGLHGQRYLNNVQNSLSTTYNRLSSGLRINSAKDDAAGLQIADRLTTQINGLNQGNRNTSDGIALAQTIEGGLDEIGNNLQRIRTLAVQAANGTNTSDDRKAISKEAASLSAEITRIAEQTKFGGKTVLKGTNTAANNNSIYKDDANAAVTNGRTGTIDFQVGANKGDTVSLSVKSFQMSVLVEIGGKITAANSIAINTDNTNANITNKGQIGVNGLIMSATGTAPASVNTIRFALSVASGAQAAIATIDALIAVVDEQRGDIGAIQNRLESSIRNQANVSANQADARSRIRDTDFAEESANLTQQNILQQAASSMLMQANMRPQLALSMLG